MSQTTEEEDAEEVDEGFDFALEDGRPVRRRSVLTDSSLAHSICTYIVLVGLRFFEWGTRFHPTPCEVTQPRFE